MLLMGAILSHNVDAALAKMAGQALLVEKCYAGKRVQIRKVSTTLTILGSTFRDLTGTLDRRLVRAMETALQDTKECILDGILQCQVPPNFPAGCLLVFDCLWVDGQPLTGHALRLRRAALRRTIPKMHESDMFLVTPSEEFTIEEPPSAQVLQALLLEAAASGCSGLILKYADGAHEAGVNSSWIALSSCSR